MPQSKLPNPVFNFIAPRVAGLPFSGGFGAMYFPGVKSLVQGDTPFLDGEVPGANGVVTARGLAKMYGVLANDGRIDGKKYLSEELARRLTGDPRRKWPDANMVVPMPFHLGYHESPVPGLLTGFGHVGSGRHPRLGRPRNRELVRLRAQPVVDAAAVRHGVVRRSGAAVARRYRGRPSHGFPARCRSSARPTPNPAARRPRPGRVGRARLRDRGGGSAAGRCRWRCRAPRRRRPGSRGRRAWPS